MCALIEFYCVRWLAIRMMAFLLKFALVPWSHQACGAAHLSGDLRHNPDAFIAGIPGTC